MNMTHITMIREKIIKWRLFVICGVNEHGDLSSLQITTKPLIV